MLVHPADLQDRAGAPWLLMAVAEALPRLELIWADSAYLGPLQTWVWETFGWRLEIVERPGGRGGGGWMREGQEPPARRPGGPAARLPAPAAPLDRRKNDRVDRAQPTDEQRRRVSACHERGVDLPQHAPADAQAVSA